LYFSDKFYESDDNNTNPISFLRNCFNRILQDRKDRKGRIDRLLRLDCHSPFAGEFDGLSGIDQAVES
jgi:predicted DNA-binding ribbon-helix-helix protein